MTTASERRRHERWLLELTGIPTASGREERVVQWVRSWVGARPELSFAQDAAGNVIIRPRRRGRQRAPLFFTAHLDHPAFVVRQTIDERTLELEFRGGVHEPYFEGAALEIIDAADHRHRARVVALDGASKPFKRAEARLSRPVRSIAAGDIGRWALRRGREPEIRAGLLHAPACDDLAGAAAALSALDALGGRAEGGRAGVLLTVAEEVGFIGAIAACKARTVPGTARLICLENSRSFADSPIGAGPIVRVGDRTSVFSPSLTNRIDQLLRSRSKRGSAPTYQRKLMAGGTCEATTFAAYGYEATCLCLALGNYHNMADIDGVIAGRRPARVAAEYISIDDYHGLIEMLVVCAGGLEVGRDTSVRDQMESLYRERREVLGKV